MADVVRLATIIRKFPPEAWDAIFPHGPAIRQAGPGFGRFAAAPLNPQPLPPRARFAVASAEVARKIADAAIVAEASGQDAGSIVARAVDEWCGNGGGRLPVPWPRPFPFPFPWPPDPDPEPDPRRGRFDVAQSRVIGALALADVASKLDDGPARDALARAAEQLMEVGVG